jgi:hypothetical protein
VNVCPIHRIPDCSPLLNGCTWTTSPERHIKAHEGATVSIERDDGGNRRIQMKVVTCTADGCIWGARTGKSRKAVIEAHRQHLLAVSIFAKRVDEEANRA